jgi:hypothetical protein
MKHCRLSTIKKMGIMGVGVVAMVLLLLPGESYAGPRWKEGRRVQQHRPAGVKALPRHHTVHRVGPRTVYHRRGTFYQRGPSGYVMVQPPVGLVMVSLPPGFSVMAFGGSTYFTFGQVTYQRCPRGYMVVERPRHHRPYGARQSGRSYARTSFSFSGRW